MKKLTLLAAVLLAFTLTTCSNPIDFVAEVTDQVMVANDKYLEVVSVAPVKGATQVSTWSTITIEFDRAIDMTTVNETTITIVPEIDLGIPSWNASTNTLSLKPPTISGLTTYTLTVTPDVKGDDGSSIREPYSWSFGTAKAPSGTVVVDGGAGYTTDGTVDLVLSFNTQAVYVGYSENSADLEDAGWAGWKTTASVGTDDTFVLSGGDGTKTIYTRFMDDEPTPAMTPLVSHVIVLDTVAPSVNGGTDKTLNIASPSNTLDATVSDATSGIASIAWTKTGGPGTVTFGTPSSEDTTVSTGTDGTYTLTLTVTDNAGLQSTDTVTVYRDLTAPTVNAGGNKVLNIASPSGNINATTSDAIGIASWLWEKTAGPGTLTFGTATAEDTTVSAGTDGTYTARLTVTDIRGNATQATITILKDITAPTVDAGTMAWLNNATPSRAANATASDGGTNPSGIASYAWSGANLSFSNAAVLTPTISGTVDGALTATLLVTDGAGNSSSDTLPISRDVTLPVVSTYTINGGATYTNNLSATITISASDAASGIDQVRFSKDTVTWLSWEAYSASRAWTLATGDGSKSVYYQVRDFAGNVRQVVDSITLDQTAPTVSFSIDAGAATSNDTSVTLNLTVSDATSGVRYYATKNDTLSWTSWMTYSTPTPTHTLQDARGTRTVYVQLQDYAGNNSSIPSDTIVLMARITVRYNVLVITDDGDADVLIPAAGEIYYTFWIDGVTKLQRTTPISVTAPDTIGTSQLPQTTYTIYEDPTSGSYQLTGRVFDDDGSVDDYGNMSSITYSAPFPASGTVIDTSRPISGDVDGIIYYTITYQN